MTAARSRSASATAGRRLVADRWVLPRFAERALGSGGDRVLSLGDVDLPVNDDPRWTVLGSAGSPGRAAVDEAGLVSPEPGRWSLDWWVGADDRWHLPSRETAVRQALMGVAPVVETRMRIPGGDAVHRVYAVAGRPDRAVVEVENDSPVPFALAFVVRPFDQMGAGQVGRIEIDHRTVSVDGRVALVLAHPPSRVATGSFDTGDCAEVVTGGEAGEGSRASIDDPCGLAQGAVIVPVAHHTRTRVVIPLGAPDSGRDPTADLDPAAVPDPEAVERGWGALLSTGLRTVLPDEGVQRAVDAARAFLLLLDDGMAVTPVPWGDEPSEPRDAAACLEALEAWGLDAHADEVRHSVPRRWRRRRILVPPDRGGAWAAVKRHMEAGGGVPNWTHDGVGFHGRAVVEFLTAVRAGLVREDGDTLDLLPELPPEWEGAPIEVHGVPTGGGLTSFAVRWHGTRPALLWEVAGAGDTGEGLRITSSGLDSSWSSDVRQGEDLLRR